MRWLLILIIFTNAALFGQRSDFSTLDFKKADSIALLFKDASLKNLPVLVHNLTTGLPSDVEKFRAIYSWVCTNIENDYGAFQKTVKKRRKLTKNPQALAAWNDSYTPKVFKKLVEHRKTACTGYAFLVREMAALADIPCTIVNGYGRTPTLMLDAESIPNHSWNAVRLNNKWYLCDPTWSAGKIILEEEGARFEADYFDGYFLADPFAFVKNHYPLETKWALRSETPSFKTFLEGPVIYKEAFAHGVTPISPTKMHLETVKNEEILFMLAASKSVKLESIRLILNNGVSNKEVQPIVHQDKNKMTLKYSIEKSGSYDVHISVADQIIATYVVKVRRK